MRAKRYALLLAIEHTKTLTTYTFIFIDLLNKVYLLLNHIRHPSSQNNHPNKLSSQTILMPSKPHATTLPLKKVRAHTNIRGNDEANKLTKQGALKKY